MASNLKVIKIDTLKKIVLDESYDKETRELALKLVDMYDNDKFVFNSIKGNSSSKITASDLEELIKVNTTKILKTITLDDIGRIVYDESYDIEMRELALKLSNMYNDNKLVFNTIRTVGLDDVITADDLRNLIKVNTTKTLKTIKIDDLKAISNDESYSDEVRKLASEALELNEENEFKFNTIKTIGIDGVITANDLKELINNNTTKTLKTIKIDDLKAIGSDPDANPELKALALELITLYDNDKLKYNTIRTIGSKNNITVDDLTALIKENTTQNDRNFAEQILKLKKDIELNKIDGDIKSINNYGVLVKDDGTLISTSLKNIDWLHSIDKNGVITKNNGSKIYPIGSIDTEDIQTINETDNGTVVIKKDGTKVNVYTYTNTLSTIAYIDSDHTIYYKDGRTAFSTDNNFINHPVYDYTKKELIATEVKNGNQYNTYSDELTATEEEKLMDIRSAAIGASAATKNDPYYNRKISKYGSLYGVGTGEGFNEKSGVLKDSTVKELMENSGIQNSSDMDWLNRFARFPYIDPYNATKSTKEYIFITKPDLHMFEQKSIGKLNQELANVPFFVDCHKRYRHIMRQLQYSSLVTKPYLTALSNSINNTLDVPDIVALESDTNENIYGDKISYRHGSSSGDVGFEFSLEFNETPNYELYHLFKMWDMYYELKTAGRVTPTSKSYIKNMELHDQVSMYKIIVGEDMETILWYAKYYGVYPKEIPRSAFSSLDNGQLRLSVNFKSAFVLDNRPNILQELNYVTLDALQKTSVSKIKAAPIWNNDIDDVNRKWVGLPFVTYHPDIPNGENDKGSKGIYKLKWSE